MSQPGSRQGDGDGKLKKKNFDKNIIK